MRIAILIVAFVIQLVLPARGGDATVQAILNLGFPFATFKSKDYVRVANQLRRLDKDVAINKMEEAYNKFHLCNDTLLLLSRLLFENPEGWKMPNWALIEPPFFLSATNEFPIFPLALSQNVPFMIIGGYNCAGLPERVMPTLEKCRSMAMIKKDLQEINLKAAARSLIRSKQFKQLYFGDARRQIAKQIMNQAK